MQRAVLAGVICACCSSRPATSPSAPEQTASRPAAPEQPAEPVPATADLGGEWNVVEALGQSVELPIPAADSWTVDESSRWWHVRHTSSNSELLVRTWPAPRSASPRSCEQQARLWRPELPEISDESTVATNRLDAPEGYLTELRVGVDAEPAARGVTGHALAFGSRPGRCLAMAYTTSAHGPSAQAIVAARLATITSDGFAKVHEISIDDRARAVRQRGP